MKPMLARDSGTDSVDESLYPGHVLEPKHDGMRAIVHRTEKGVDIYSRTLKSQNGKAPLLEASLLSLPVGTVLDGEVAMIDRTIVVEGKTIPVANFNSTMRVMGSAPEKAAWKQEELSGQFAFLAFDMPSVDGIWEARRNLLEETARDINGVYVNAVFYENLAKVNQALMDKGVEGSIVKNPQSLYVPGGRPRNTWYKFKRVSTYDVVVMDAYEGEGKHDGRLGGFIYGVYDGADLIEIGRVGGGFSDEERESYWQNVPIGATIEIKANELVGSGVIRTPRHPQFITLRIDKPAWACTVDQFKEGS